MPAPPPAHYHVKGQTVVGPGPISLPAICVRCGRAAEQGKRTERRFSWVPKWLYVLLVNWLIFVLVYLLVRKSVHLGYSQCHDCRARQMGWMWCTAGAFVAAIALTFPAIEYESRIVVLSLIGTIVAAIVFAFFAQGPVRVENHRAPDFVISGLSPEMLRQLEDFEGEFPSRDCRSCGEPLRAIDSTCPICGTPARR